jgi:hypothetical protein
MEKILRIEEVDGIKQRPSDSPYTSSYAGYFVVTDKQTIKILIEDGQSCCENWGYLSTNDNTNEFVGSEITGIVLTDMNLASKELPEFKYVDADHIQFVNIETDKGILQFAVYNDHNGYYGHEILIDSEQLKETACL